MNRIIFFLFAFAIALAIRGMAIELTYERFAKANAALAGLAR